MLRGTNAVAVVVVGDADEDEDDISDSAGEARDEPVDGTSGESGGGSANDSSSARERPLCVMRGGEETIPLEHVLAWSHSCPLRCCVSGELVEKVAVSASLSQSSSLSPSPAACSMSVTSMVCSNLCATNADSEDCALDRDRFGLRPDDEDDDAVAAPSSSVDSDESRVGASAATFAPAFAVEDGLADLERSARSKLRSCFCGVAAPVVGLQLLDALPAVVAAHHGLL